ncbi:hypothetical protein BFW01_g1513 [Lasiodiplodia theobromae]|nr:hypothetical protein BFW01_g1513 [Lasiodiplodia theobromae]
MDNDAERLQRPGFGLPITLQPDGQTFPSAVHGWSPDPATEREHSMLAVMDALTDKPDWERKVFDDAVVARWRAEAVYEPPPLRSWSHVTHTTRQGFDDGMFDFCIAELRDKAALYASKRFVRVLDTGAAVAKSDVLVPDSLRQELVRAVAELLEDGVPEAKKDWHPRSDEQVLDLVHPSLFPLVYGRSKILGDAGRTLGLDDCLAEAGCGETVPREWIEQVWGSQNKVCRYWNRPLWSNHFQWLPCEVAFTEEGKTRIASYVNNLHPIRQRALYPLIERVMDAAMPLWEEVLGYTAEHHEAKTYIRVALDDPPKPYDEDNSKHTSREFKVDLRQKFASEGLQVIVKLANIHLTPEKPNYRGGSWHVEGMQNEWICATAIYYYDCDNVTDSYLGFRQGVDTEYITEKQECQFDWGGLEYIYGFRQEQPSVQDVGHVLTKQGRLIAFPNVFQHRVEPFSLQDRSRPGHRKILALFLVDPHQRIISTANVPPQRNDWWAEEVANGRVGELPAELTEIITMNVDDWPMGMEEAKDLREELMIERTATEAKFDDQVFEKLNFCEH